MEYCANGTSADLRNDQLLEEMHIAVILRDVLKALVYLHERKIIHRDIKGNFILRIYHFAYPIFAAANILVTGELEIKLGDFGVAKQLSPLFNDASQTCTYVGTPYWMAPEVLKRAGYDFTVCFLY